MAADPMADRLERGADAIDPPAKPLPTIRTAADLAGMTFPEARWCVPGILPDGACILAGKPKTGKSWLSLALAVAIASGGRALGQIAVEPGDVLYLALEDHERRLQERLERIGGAWPVRLHLVTEWPRADAGGLELIGTWLGEHPAARLVIIDTLARVRPPRSRNGDMYTEDYVTVGALKRLADEHKVCVLIVHHQRKMTADDPFDTISGTNGLTAAADATYVLERDRQTPTATLHITGRDVEEQALALAWQSATCTWSITTHEAASAQRLVAVLTKVGGKSKRHDLQNLQHWTASELDAAITAAGEAVRCIERPRRDGKPFGRRERWVALASCDISDVLENPSGGAILNVADSGLNVAREPLNVARTNGCVPSGSGLNVANVANAIGGTDGEVRL